MSVPSELTRLVRLDELGGVPRALCISADEAERVALARRFGLVAIASLDADAEVRRDGDAVLAEGRLRGAATQSCVATGDPLPVEIAAPFALRFVPATDAAGDDVELSATDCDTILYEGGAVDLGEAIAAEFVLALDPFPRVSDAEARLRAAGIATEEDAGPFAVLKALKDKLG